MKAVIVVYTVQCTHDYIALELNLLVSPQLPTLQNWIHGGYWGMRIPASNIGQTF